MTGSLTNDQVEKPSDFGEGDAGEVRRYVTEYQMGEKYAERYRKRCRNIAKRYRDQRGSDGDDDGVDRGWQRKFNILWSNIQTLSPATYAKPPKPQVERRWRDSDPLGRVAVQILERSLQFAIDERAHEVLKKVRDDFLLFARGNAWLRYVPHFRDATIPPKPPEMAAEGYQVTNAADEDDSLDSKAGAVAVQREVVFEEVVPDHVKQEDWGHNPARDWSEVRLIYRKAYLTRDELVERFGKEIGGAVPLDYTPSNMPHDRDGQAKDAETWKKATVIEMWDKPARKVVWLNPGYSARLLDKRDDPLKLKEFFPCPRPAYGTLTSDSLIPVPDYAQYQDQARELDDLTARISRMVDVCRIMGLYDGQNAGIGRMFQEGADNQLLPEDSWPTFASSGGLQGKMDIFDLQPVVKALSQLYASRKQVQQDLNEITGISDIIRGQSVASETATAQQIKGQFATLRLRDKQEEMQRFARDMVALIGEIISEKFSPETLALMSGAEVASDPLVKARFDQAVGLLRNDALRSFRINIETDSTIALDENAMKQQATEFMGAFGQMMTQVVEFAGAAGANPVIAPLGEVIGQAMLFSMRQYRAGRALEGAMETAIEQMKKVAETQAQQPAKPAPAAEAAQAKAAGEQAVQQARVQGIQATAAAKVQQTQAMTQAKTQQIQVTTQAKAQAHQMDMANAAKLAEMEIVLKNAEAQAKQVRDWMDHQQGLAQAAAAAAQASLMPGNGRVM